MNCFPLTLFHEACTVQACVCKEGEFSEEIISSCSKIYNWKVAKE